MSSPNIEQALQSALQHHRAGRLGEAERLYRYVLEREPARHEALHMLGLLAWQMGELEVASKLIGKALALDPNCPEAHNNLGNVFQSEGKLDEAMAAFQKAIDLKPDYPEAHYNVGNLHQARGQFDEAVTCFQRAVTLNPSYAMAWSNLGNTLTCLGQLEDAIAACRSAIALDPTLSAAHTNLGLALSLHPDFKGSDVRGAYRGWHDWYAGARVRPIRSHGNDPSPDRRLRLGYLSPDFRRHVVGSNLLPLLREHDRRHFEIFCYANVLHPDALTDEIRSLADGWRNIVCVSDEHAAEMIRADQIDILVDLASHTEGNRALLVAATPAPIQVTYLGSIAPSGLESIAHRLSDPYLHAPGENPSGAGKGIIRLATSYWCYEPLGPSPEPSSLPALVSKSVTFGCLANFSKVSERALKLWVEILRQITGARLILHAPEGSCRTRVCERFTSGGVAPEALEFVGRDDWEGYVRTWQRIDIGLDPFPYNGGITTCDALWMGVPVVTLSGQTAVGRAGRSILSNIGLPELIAETPEEYLATAVALATDLPRLSELRSTLRGRMERSPLRDAKGHAREVETTYRKMWREWCVQKPLK